MIEKELLELPALIKDCEKELYLKSKKFSEAELVISLKKNSIILEIAQEVNEAGKPKFSNKESRDAELDNRVSKSEELNVSFASFQADRDSFHELKIELVFFQNRLSVLRSIVRLRGGVDD